MIKPLLLAGALLMLTACEKEPPAAPAPAKAEPPAPQIPAAPQPAAETPPDLKIEVAPATEQASETKPPVRISVPKPPPPGARAPGCDFREEDRTDRADHTPARLEPAG